MDAMVHYEGDVFTGGKSLGPVRVTVARAAVEHHGQAFDKPLPQEVASLFIDAIERAGVPVAAMLARVQQLRELRPDLVAEAQASGGDSPRIAPAWALDPQPFVHVESWPAAIQPWPVYVSIGSEVVAEFYPTTFNDQTLEQLAA